MNRLQAFAFMVLSVFLVSGCASVKAADPWGGDSSPRQVTKLSMAVYENAVVQKRHWAVLLKSPENLLELSYQDYYDGNNIILPETDFEKLRGYVEKYLGWIEQIKKENLVVKEKMIGNLPCELEFFGGGYSTESSVGSSYKMPVKLTLGLKTLDGVSYLVLKLPASGVGSADPGVFFAGRSYWLSPSEASQLGVLVAPGSHDRYKAFFSGQVAPSPSDLPTPVSDDDANRLLP